MSDVYLSFKWGINSNCLLLRPTFGYDPIVCLSLSLSLFVLMKVRG